MGIFIAVHAYPVLRACSALPTYFSALFCLPGSVSPFLPACSARPILPTCSVSPVLSTCSVSPVLPTCSVSPVLPTIPPVLSLPVTSALSCQLILSGLSYSYPTVTPALSCLPPCSVRSVFPTPLLSSPCLAYFPVSLSLFCLPVPSALSCLPVPLDSLAYVCSNRALSRNLFHPVPPASIAYTPAFFLSPKI
jgi:hypothetical protein